MKHIFFLTFCILYSSCDNRKTDVNYRGNGVLVSASELAEIKKLAEEGKEPHQTNVRLLIQYIDSMMEVSSSWEKLDGEVLVEGRSSSDPIQISSTGGKVVYGAALAWHLTGEEKYAAKSKALILDLGDTYSYRNAEKEYFHWGAQGILNLARGGTPYLYAADLLEGWEGWTADDKLSYQVWLKEVMYPKVSWASRFRKNNWGVAGSFSASLISWYLMDHPDWILEEIGPYPSRLSPTEAFDAHNEFQLGRMKTTKDWEMDAKVHIWGILPNGAIPDEIRRGDDPVDGDHLPSMSSGTRYSMTHIEHLTAHAEFLRRQGNTSIYDHEEPDGSGSLLQAYRFIIDNPIQSHCFTLDRRNALYIAYDYYKHPALLKSLQECGPASIMGQRMALYARLTHPLEIP